MRRRADAILEGYVRRAEKQVLDRLADFAKKGEIDRAMELLVRRPNWPDEEAAWQVMTGLAHTLIDLGEKEFGKPAVPASHDLLPAGDFRRYAAAGRPLFAAPRSQVTGRVESYMFRSKKNLERVSAFDRVLVRAEAIQAGQCRGELLVSTGSLHEGTDRETRTCEFTQCVVFAGGSVELHDARGSVIVCAGDFKADYAGDCLIVGRGDVRCSGLGRCRIFAQGDVECPGDATNCGIVASGKVSLSQTPRNIQGTEVIKGRPNPLGFVKWFEPSSVGVVVEAAERGLRLKEATEGKPFARAGLRAGDLAVSADGKEIGSAEDFRRLLRRKVVMQEDLPLEVRRDGQLLKLVVSFKE